MYHKEKKDIRIFQRYFPNNYNLNELTNDIVEDFLSHNPIANEVLLLGIEVGKHVAHQRRPQLLNAKYSAEIGRFAQQQIGNLMQEQLSVALLDTQLNVIGWEVVFVGTLSQVQASPREIFQLVLKANAFGFMIAHNHPSGNIMPSNADITFSQRLATIGHQMDLRLFDSFIVTQNEYWSMSENQQLKKVI
ncbi:MAG: JAB domain-containing protein [Leuconostoc sp.]|nr:JAB domain-containing protein [Leuconostoc sp.]